MSSFVNARKQREIGSANLPLVSVWCQFRRLIYRGAVFSGGQKQHSKQSQKVCALRNEKKYWSSRVGILLLSAPISRVVWVIRLFFVFRLRLRIQWESRYPNINKPLFSLSYVFQLIKYLERHPPQFWGNKIMIYRLLCLSSFVCFGPQNCHPKRIYVDTRSICFKPNIPSWQPLGCPIYLQL